MSTLRDQCRIQTDFRIIDENPDFLVVDKPPFLQVHPSKPSDKRTLWDGLRELLAYEIANGGQVSIINRLDRETSGLTLVAKSRAAARSLCRQMEKRHVTKRYVAIAWGWPEADEWTVDAPILRRGDVEPSPIYLKQMVHADGAPSRTNYRVLRRISRETANGNKFCLVQAEPETGRMHQIRVHLTHSGHPMVGDKIYGPDEQCYLEFIETGWTQRLSDKLLLPRHALHANELCLDESGRTWSSQIPADLRNFLAPGDTGGNSAEDGQTAVSLTPT